MRTSYEQCKETYECSLAHYCWYASDTDKKEAIKKCLPLYSQDHGTRFGWESENYLEPTIDDYKYNGQYCKSGLAFPDYEVKNKYTARCTSTDHIDFDGKMIKAPYECDPTDNAKKCQLFFNVTNYIPGQQSEQRYVETTCRCAMDGRPNVGYCGQVLGTKAYEDSLYVLKPVLEKSNCHTLDRWDFRAHRDTCGVGPDEAWAAAVQQRYRVNHWQYVHAEDGVAECVEDSMLDSFKNLVKGSAAQRFLNLLGFSVFVLLSVS